MGGNIDVAKTSSRPLAPWVYCTGRTHAGRKLKERTRSDFPFGGISMSVQFVVAKRLDEMSSSCFLLVFRHS